MMLKDIDIIEMNTTDLKDKHKNYYAGKVADFRNKTKYL